MLDKRRTNFFFFEAEKQSRLKEFYLDGDCFPIDVVIHPTTRCNHSCGFCYHQLNFSGKIHQDFSTPRFLRLLEELRGVGTNNLVISGGGEPLRHEDIVKMMSTASKFPFSSIYTNLDVQIDNLMIDSLAGLSTVNVNLSSSDPNTYRKVRGQNANLLRVKSNLSDLLTLQPKVNGIITVRPNSLPSLEKTIEDLLSWGVSGVIVSPAFDLNYKDGISSDTCIQNLERLKKRTNDQRVRILEPEEKIAVDSKGRHVCNTHYFDVTIGADETIYPCCNVAYLSKYGIVNLKDYSTFKEAWKSEERKAWINAKKISCKSCWLAPASRAVEEGKK